MNVEFRVATIDDVKGIVDLCNECFFEETSLEYAQDVFKKYEHDKNQIYLIGLVDGKIIAHAKVTVIQTIYEKMNTYSVLNHVCVKPEYRRHHIGMKLLDECKKISKENNCVKMELWSNNFREPAHALYKKYGFVVNDAKFFSFDL